MTDHVYSANEGTKVCTQPSACRPRAPGPPSVTWPGTGASLHSRPRRLPRGVGACDHRPALHSTASPHTIPTEGPGVTNQGQSQEDSSRGGCWAGVPGTGGRRGPGGRRQLREGGGRGPPQGWAGLPPHSPGLLVSRRYLAGKDCARHQGPPPPWEEAEATAIPSQTRRPAPQWPLCLSSVL